MRIERPGELFKILRYEGPCTVQTLEHDDVSYLTLAPSLPKGE